MSRTFKKNLDVFTLIITVLFASTNSAFAAAVGHCANAMPLELDSAYRGHATNETEVFVLEVPVAGIATVEVSVPGATSVDVKLGFLGRGCSLAVDADAVTIDRSATHQTIAFAVPGSYFFRAAAQDPLHSLGAYKLQTSFVEAEIVEDVFDFEIGPRREWTLVHQARFYVDHEMVKTESEEVDPNPKARDLGRDPILRLVSFYSPSFGKTESEEVDPNPKASSFDPRATLVLFGDSLTKAIDKTESEEVDPNPKSAAKTESEEVDPNPKSDFHQSRLLSGKVAFYAEAAAKTESEEVDPNPKTESEEVDPNPKNLLRTVSESSITLIAEATQEDSAALLEWLAGLVWNDIDPNIGRPDDDRFQLVSYVRATQTNARGFRVAGQCRLEAGDDHGDTFGCATVLRSRRIGGQIANDWSDDVDLFTFTLSSAETVQIETSGASDTFGGLYDRMGQRLAAADDGGAGANFRIVKTLEPGQYFIRVEGTDQSQGVFDLTVDALAW